MRTYRPSSKYLGKLQLTLFLIALVVLASGALLGWLLSLDKELGSDAFRITLIVTAALDLVWWLPAVCLAGPYYRSLSYEIRDDEVVVRVGIVTKSVKHVPFRTVTNLTVKRGILDRWFFDLGTLNIQTAGMSGNTGAEESLVGLANYGEVYEMVAAELRRFRGGMAPTAADVDIDSSEALTALLGEVRAIRETLEARS
jgi:membrane protein YdbS with pleckstrin-like domain